MPRLSDCFEPGIATRLALLIALIGPSLNACAPDKTAHSATETGQSGSSTSGTANVTSGTPTSGTTSATSGLSTSGTTNATSGSSTSGSETTDATSDPLTGTSSATTGGFQWPQYPPVKCGDVLCAEGELCVSFPGFPGCCSGAETSGGPDTTTGEMDCEPGYDAAYFCEAYPDYCLGFPDPLDCLDYFFCGGGPAPFSGGVLECLDGRHDC